MPQLVALALVFSVFTALSIALTGNRALLSGNLLSITGLFELATNWRFILSMTLALGCRFIFIFINRTALQIPSLAASSTTVTAVVTALAYPAVLVANAYLLRERFTVMQLVGTALLMTGIVLSCIPSGR